MATKHIALVEWPQDGYAVQALRGILAYAAQHGSWEFRHSALHAPGLMSLRRDRPDAIIARLDEADERMPELGRLRRPIVNLEGRQWARGVTFVSTDDRMVGRLAGQYFLNRGYRCIAFCAMECSGPWTSQGQFEGRGTTVWRWI